MQPKAIALASKKDLTEVSKSVTLGGECDRVSKQQIMASARNLTLALCSAATASVVIALPIGVLSQTLPVATSVQPNIFQAIILGMVQGLTEFLPISSTAHLKVIPVVLGWGDPGVAFTAVIQLGSIAAVLWYFWSDLSQITVGAFTAIKEKNYKSYDLRLAIAIILGTLPIVFFGLLIKAFIPDFDNSPIRSLGAIAIASIVMSLLLGLAEQIGKRKRDYQHLNIKDGIFMGLAQAVALIPGVSRSGSTLTAGLFIGLERAAAARFSFLLGIPAITLAGIVELKGALEQGISNDGIVTMVIGVVSAAIFSYLAIAWLLKFLQTQNTWVFVWYRLAFGAAILAAIATKLLPNL